MLSLNVSMAPLRHTTTANKHVSQALERLSSGRRLNRAADDAAGLQTAERMRAQVMGLGRAGRNIQDAINLIRIGAQGVQGLISPLQRIRELAVQAANRTNGAQELQGIQAEIDQQKQLVVQAYQLAQKANIDFASPSGSRLLVFQVGANQGDTLTFDYTGVRDTLFKFAMQSYGYSELYNSPLQGTLAFEMGGFAPPPNALLQAAVPKRLDVTVAGGASAAIQLIDQALYGAPATAAPVVLPATSGILAEVAKLGALENRLMHAYDRVMVGYENQAAAESRIRDADMALEVTGFVRSSLLQQTGLSMVAQANAQATRLQQLLFEVEPLASETGADL